MNSNFEFLPDIELKYAGPDQILNAASKALIDSGRPYSSLSLTDVSGNSGSKTYLCSA